MFGGELGRQCFSSFPADRGSAGKLGAATLNAWRHTDDALSSFVSSEASWAASRCLKPSLLVYAIDHGSRSNMSPLYTSVNLSRLLIRPLIEWNRAGMRYHIVIAC